MSILARGSILATCLATFDQCQNSSRSPLNRLWNARRSGWIRNCEKPGISLPSPPYYPAMCEPSCEEADHQSLEIGGDRGKLPQIRVKEMCYYIIYFNSLPKIR